MKTKVIVEEQMDQMPDEVRITSPGIITQTETFRPVRGGPSSLWVKLDDGWYHFSEGEKG